ncbi:MAG: hypothetical protein GF364_11775, partial [Candidatus Lokiarchaeota archaeon]|nr:hypothetical protein [Candidatus Lokiarchaeota archaeon]
RESIKSLNKKFEQCDEQIKKIKEKITPLKDVKNKLEEKEKSLEQYRESYDLYTQNEKISNKLKVKEQSLTDGKRELEKIQKLLDEKLKDLEETKEKFDEDRFQKLKKDIEDLKEERAELKGELKQIKARIKKIEETLKEYKKIENKLQVLKTELEKYKSILTLQERIRSWFRDSGLKLGEVLLRKISSSASYLFQEIMDNSTLKLEWDKNYEIKVSSNSGERAFKRLSGGEQMSAALSVRLALIKIFSKIDIAFFDEPTTNLDYEKKQNLAQCIQNIKGFTQLFVISHDDTFENMADYVLRFEKDEQNITKVEPV